MYILGIESSCDETAVALIERGRRNRVIDEKIKSQIPIHKKFGGVVPELASRNHYEIIDILTYEIFKDHPDIKLKDISLIAYTQGPGLVGSLLIGLTFAKALSYRYKIPLIGVDHIQGHIQAAFIENPTIEYPLIGLVVSGGHTSIYLKNNFSDVLLLNKTRDDAAGEVMDKTAKYFDLGYPGGPILDQLYSKGDPYRFTFTVPKMSDGSGDFSFSGYKTAIINLARKHEIKAHTKDFFDLISSFLHRVTDYLLNKVIESTSQFNAKSVILSGGVGRNTLLRDKFTDYYFKKDTKLYLPPLKYCTDNASMIAWLGYEIHQSFPKRNYFDYRANVYSRGFSNPSKPYR